MSKLNKSLKIIHAFQISEDDAKPKQVCYNCCNKLDDFNDFIEICQSSDYKFETILFSANQPEEPNILEPG